MTDFLPKEYRDAKGRFVKGVSMDPILVDKSKKTRTGVKRDNGFGTKSSGWKGNKAGYRAVHLWLNLQYGKPNYCENCKDTKEQRYEWANKTGELLRERSNWERLCVRCHRIKDDWLNKVMNKRLINYGY
jgi:hypothetical protein